MLAPVQSGAPFGAATQSSWPDTTLVAGKRATVPAASPTPLARSPAALVVAPSVSPAPRTPAPTLEIDWSMNFPMAPIVSCGVGSRAPPCGGSGGAVITAGGSDGGGLAPLASTNSGAATSSAPIDAAAKAKRNGSGAIMAEPAGAPKRWQK